MKSFIAATLFAASVLAVAPSGGDYETGEWGFTFTMADGKTSVTAAAGVPAETTASFPAALTQVASGGGGGVWTSYTSYTATYSSGASTWGVPTTLSYSIGEGWTSQIPAPQTSSASSVAPVSTESPKPTTLAPSPTVKPATTAAATTSPTASAFTGAANINNGKIAGVGAMAMAGLALVL